MAAHATHKNQSEFKNAFTLERKRIRNAKYAIRDEKENAQSLRAIARELNAEFLVSEYVPASPDSRTFNPHKNVTHALVMRGVK